MEVEVVGTLHESHRVGIDLRKLLYLLSREGAQRVGYAHLVFADDDEIALAEQFVVLEQGTGYGVFYGHGSHHGGIVGQMVKLSVKRVKRHRRDVTVSKIEVGGCIVVATVDALYAHS